MTTVRTDILGVTRDSARRTRFEPVGSVTATNIQKAVEQIATQPTAVSATAVNVGASPYDVQQGDTVIYVDTSGGPVTIRPQAAADRLGQPLTVKDVTGNASTNNITIDPSGAETVDGLATFVINADFGGVRLYPRSGTGYTVAP